MSTAKKLAQHYTWGDYRRWPGDERWELVSGEAFAMSPAPSTRHQIIALNVGAKLLDAFEGKKCRPMIAPTDVRLSDEDVVQPDAFVVCDPNQIKESYVEGAPALVVEVLSPASLSHDRVRKLRLYAKFGVREYWLVTPNPAVVEILLLDGDSYRIHGVYRTGETLQSATFPELTIPLDRIFTLPVPPEEDVNEIRESTVPYHTAETT